MATCPVCGEPATQAAINEHLDKGCPKKRTSSANTSISSATNANKVRKTSMFTPKSEVQTSFSVSNRKATSFSQSNVESSQENAKPNSQVNSDTTATQGNNSPASQQESSEKETNTITPSRPVLLSNQPLAEQMRPRKLEDYVGQHHLLSILKQLFPNLPSLVLWGPSGAGKTTLARALANECNARFIELSAPSAGTTDVKKVVADAKREWQLLKRRTVLFLDEIHRFSRSQQDSLLAAVEKGDIILIGATTENPSFKLAGALLSRLQVFILKPLSQDDLREIIRRTVDQANFVISNTEWGDPVEMIVDAANGDARVALNMLETLSGLPPGEDPRLLLKHTLVHDQRGDSHYDLISAFHKSIRGSDADAALYYLGRMLEGGEDPLYVSRRLIRIASEDIGLADDTCLPFAVAAHTSVQQIGMPECDVILAHAAVKFARAPKSVEVYKAYGALKAGIANQAAPQVPIHLRNAPTKLMQDVGYGAEYKYNPAYIGEVRQTYLPSQLGEKRWLGQWKPTERDT